MFSSLVSTRLSRTLRSTTTALALLIALAPACSSDDSVPLVPATRLCEPGLTRQCVGDGACAGGQVCAEDGGSWGACRCDVTGGAGGTTSGGSGGSGAGSGGKGGAAGKASAGGSSQTGGKSGSASGGSAGGAGTTGGTGQGGDDGGDAGAGGGDAGAGGGDAGAGGGSSAGAGGSGAGGSSGEGGASGGGQAGAGVSGSGGSGGACDATPTTAVPLPADIFLMLDKSSSMDVAVSGSSATKWTLAVKGLSDGIDAVGAADRIGMGLALFPFNTCNPDNFAKAVVAVGDLPGNAAALKTRLASTKPDGGDTPTKPAVEGAILFAQKRMVSFPGRSPVVVLLTDGEPNECTTGFPSFPPKDVISEVSAVAKAGADAGVSTYVVGVFASTGADAGKNAVQKWAVAGGTNKAFVLASSATLASDLTVAFSSIVATAGVCAYGVPAAVSSAPTKAIVVRQSASGDVPLTRVAGASSCNGGDWFYDDEAAPTKMLLCPAACATMRGTPNAKILVSPSCSP